MRPLAGEHERTASSHHALAEADQKSAQQIIAQQIIAQKKHLRTWRTVMSSLKDNPATLTPAPRCERFWPLLDLPPAGRTDDEQQALTAHLAECPTCSRLEQRLERALQVHAAWPLTSTMPTGLAEKLESHERLNAFWTLAGELEPPSKRQQHLSGTLRRSAWSENSAGLALAASLLLGMVGYGVLTLPSRQAATDLTPPTSIAHSKGPGGPAATHADVRLTLLLEQKDGGARRLANGERLPAGAGLLFELILAPGYHLELLKRSPDGHVERLYPDPSASLRLQKVAWQTGPGDSRQVYTLEFAQGGPARYTLDNAPGEHQFAAVAWPFPDTEVGVVVPEQTWATAVEGGAAPPELQQSLKGVHAALASVVVASTP